MLSKIVDLKTRLTNTEQQLADAQAQLAQGATIAAPALAPAPAPAVDYSAMERQISAALIAAQQTSDAIVAEAQENADRIRSEADAKAREVIRQAWPRSRTRSRRSTASRLPARTSRTST